MLPAVRDSTMPPAIDLSARKCGLQLDVGRKKQRHQQKISIDPWQAARNGVCTPCNTIPTLAHSTGKTCSLSAKKEASLFRRRHILFREDCALTEKVLLHL